MAQLSITDVIAKPLLRMKPVKEDYERYLQALQSLKEKLNPEETEEFNKNLIRDFLLDSFYRGHNEINTSGQIDHAIYDGNSANFPVAVLMEAKSPSNKGEFPSHKDLNCKAMQETVLYFMDQRYVKHNTSIKFILITNGYEWYLFDAHDYQKYFYANKKLYIKTVEYLEKRSIYTLSKEYYENIAKPYIDQVKEDLNYVYVDIRALKSAKDQMNFYKLISPYHLLKKMLKYTDSNALNKEFYAELLHIIGLEEVKENNKLVIKRKADEKRDENSLLEATLYRLQMGANIEDDHFETALNLVITWINRILFLKLLESQLISYHPRENREAYKFLSIDNIRDYGELNELFFNVLAVPVANRDTRLKVKYANVPYLNSSLFEVKDNERTLCIDSLRKGGIMPTYKHTVLQDKNGKRLVAKLDTLEYLFCFLDAYDFGAERGNHITKEKSKTLINASVLGMIFEKINGYKDGSYFTPGMITQYMCQETITHTVLDKFNEQKGWNCEDLHQLQDRIGISRAERQEANDVINSITICDPAVGSGHFLVSALNELIAIKSKLRILQDENGDWLKEWNIEVENDELSIKDGLGERFQYNPKDAEALRVQKTLFQEKRYLIEHCLFGVDLNPNSVNICRLRLWIELLKNAYYREDGQLETLPNIDINIKCGNSLISKFVLNTPISSILQSINKSIIDYRQAIDQYQNARSKQERNEINKMIEGIKLSITSGIESGDYRRDKLHKLSHELDKLKNKDELFGEKIKYSKKTLLRIGKIEAEIRSIKQEIEEIKSNKLYENALEWRIEFPEVLDEDGNFIGFDIVIGNPPYISAPDQIKDEILAKQRKCIINSKRFDSLCSKWDLYIPFIEIGIRHLCRNNGLMAMIVPYSVTNQTYGKLIREQLIRDHTLIEISDLKGTKIFENASVVNCILFAQKSVMSDENIRITHLDNRTIDLAFTQPVNKLMPNKKTTVWNLSQDKQEINKYSTFHKIGDYCYVSKGMVINADEKTAKGEFKKEDLISLIKDDIHCREYVEAKDIDKYCVKRLRYLEYNTPRCPNNLSRPTFKELYEQPKLMINRLGHFHVYYDQSKLLTSDSMFCAVPWISLRNVNNKSIEASIKRYSKMTRAEMEDLSQSIDLRYLLGILNSKYANVLLTNLRGGDYHIYPEHVRNIPIAPATPENQQPIIDLVDKILFAKQMNPTSDTSDLENKIDELVYNLYGLTEP